MKKRIAILFILCLALILPLIACSKIPEDTGAEGTPGAAENARNIETLPEETEAKPDIPVKDMGGREISLLTAGWSNYAPLDICDIAPDEITNEILNDAAYNRKVTIEEQYKCKIMQTHNGDSVQIAQTLQKSVSAQDNAYDIAIVRGREFTSLLTGGYLLELSDLSYVDFNNPWWKKNAYDALAIGGKHYGVCGDISTNELMTAWITCFNKSMVRDYGTESPYDLVKSGNWTFDKAVELAKSVARDIDGDGVMTIDDLWGINYTSDTVIGVLNSAGVTIAKLDSDGIPEITIGSESNLSKIQNISEKLFNELYSVNTFELNLYDFDGAIFADERCFLLFTATHLVNALRQMDTEFGIVPYPKYNAEQSDYLPCTAGIFLPIVCVPKTNPDTENTSLFMEAFAYEGSKTVVPAFYENILKGKMTRDDESVDMLDYIFGNISYDTGNLFNFDGFAGSLPWDLATNKGRNIASLIEKKMSSLEKAIEKVINEVNK